MVIKCVFIVLIKISLLFSVTNTAHAIKSHKYWYHLTDNFIHALLIDLNLDLTSVSSGPQKIAIRIDGCTERTDDRKCKSKSRALRDYISQIVLERIMHGNHL